MEKALNWFNSLSWKPFPFQLEAWEAYLNGYSGLLNAPTGCGKTYALMIPALLEGLKESKKEKGIRIIWITPIRALSKEIFLASQRAIKGLGLDWKVGIRTGDTSPAERAKIKKSPPEILITTPESLHILIAGKHHEHYFRNLKSIIIDEWHELIGSKRGVQTELALSRFKGFLPELKIWGISATIGNLNQALEVLLGKDYQKSKHKLIRADIHKEIYVEAILPNDINTFSWGGHVGIQLLDKVLDLIHKSQTSLIFTNTRGLCEIWYQKLLEFEPDLAGQIAMHHGSMSREIRDWVEEQLHIGKIKAVVCTSSLDLGVDFRPVETIVQVGSPKGVARFVQRAGRSGHQPGATSKIFFVPTHALELMECAALRAALSEKVLEVRDPYIRSFDVLVQYLVTLSVGDGFEAEKTYKEVRSCLSYQSVSKEEWNWVLKFIVHGGEALYAYDEFQKVYKDEKGKYRIINKRMATRHMLSIGTIISEASIAIHFVSGKKLGSMEEFLIAQLKPGDTFWFAGRSLEFVRIKGMVAQVKKSNKKTGRTPSWMGGRMPLSTTMSEMLRRKVYQYDQNRYSDIEMSELEPLLEIQKENSILPDKDEFLIEHYESREGHHLIFYPFEGRNVHEGMSTLIAKRISRIHPISFSIAMNDYGFELLSDQYIPIEEAIEEDLFSTKFLSEDIQASLNSVEMAKRKFRDIAKISGLLFIGYPGKLKRERHLQSSSSLLFDVFKEYDPDNLLFQQTYDELLYFQLEEVRLRKTLERIQKQKIRIVRPGKFTPFAFPIVLDRLREKLTSERLMDRIEKMKMQLQK
ncbi:MAG: ligase-associated DNA damage response DEXH box helicase [Bacteroidota bacterium]